MVDAVDSKSTAARHVSSTLTTGIFILKGVYRMNIQFGGIFPSARVKRGKGGMPAWETVSALDKAKNDAAELVRSGKANRTEVVMLDWLVLPELPKETGLMLVIATDEDADTFNRRKNIDPQNLAREIYAKALIEEAKSSNP